MPTGISALPQTSGTTEREMQYASWDPQFQVPVNEPLGYYEEAGTGYLKRLAVSADGRLLVSGSTGGGTLSLAGDASSNRVSAFQTDAGLLRVSSIGGSFSSSPLSADSSSVSAIQESASNLRISAFSNDASLMRVSALGVSVTTSPLSADSSSISAKQSDAANLRVSSFNLDAGTFLVSAAQKGTWSLTALATESTSFIGNVSSTIKNFPLIVSGQVSANIDSGSVSAKQGTYPWSISGNVSAKIDSGTVSAYSPDAALFRVSSIGGSLSLSADASGNRVSAVQEDAANLMVSAKSQDAALFRVSAVGGTAGDNTLVDGTTHTISATITPVSAKPGSTIGGLVTNINSYDAAQAHVSSYQGGSWTLSAFLNEGSVSARQGDYPWSVSGNVSTAINEGTNFLGNVSTTIKNYPLVVSGTISAFINQGTVSAAGGSLSALLKEGTAFVGQVSAAGGQLSATLKEGTAFVGQVSAKVTDAANFLVSAKSDSAGQLRVSAFSDSAATLNVSAKSDSAALFRVSADLIANTTGALSVFRSINLSASQAVKATAGSLYGYYLANTDTKFNYVKFYNTSAAINVGTDTPILTVPLPPSAAANMEFPHGLVGFTNGIGIVSLSAIADNATTSSPASAVVGNIFYK